MLTQNKLIALVCPLLIFAYIVFTSREDALQQVTDWLKKEDNVDGYDDPADSRPTFALPVGDHDGSEDSHDHEGIEHYDNTESDNNDYYTLVNVSGHREIFSLSTTNRTYLPIHFGDGVAVYNPNIIPHPTNHEMWVVLAQHEQSDLPVDFEELACNASLVDGVLACVAPPVILPVPASIRGVCKGEMEGLINTKFGPRDARMFYGPKAPYVIYGSQSTYTCLGLWVQDLRILLQDFHLEDESPFLENATEVLRPPPYNDLEKNFFLFWDIQGELYVHFDIFPNRTFAQLSNNGSVGQDLAPLAAVNDSVCLAKYMPIISPHHESIHQATNSLSITLCKRSDPDCAPNDVNTFIMTIFQHKTYYGFHAIYEPYVMLFQRIAPFPIHAVSQRPLWIHGRGPFTAATGAVNWKGDYYPPGHSEMFYITSMSWKSHEQNYHGYIDDVLFLAIGIEDSKAAVIDILAGDLLQDLGLCAP